MNFIIINFIIIIEIIKMCFLVAGAFATMIISLIIISLIQAAMAKMYGFFVASLSIMGIVWDRDRETGRYTVRFNKFTIVSECLVTLDVTKPMTEESLEESERNNIKFIKTSTIVSSIIIVILSIVSFRYFQVLRCDYSMKYVSAFLQGLGIYFVVFPVTLIIAAAKTIKRTTKGLGAEVEKIRRLLLRGFRFESMDLKPLEQLGYSDSSVDEKRLYYCFYCEYLLSMERIEELGETVEKLREILKNKGTSISYMPSYYWLIFYYSEFDVNPAYANKFFNITRKALIADKDANGRRILAYYYYGIKKDYATARKYLDEGLNCVDKFPVVSEREIERKLLLKLDERLKQKEYV